MKFLFTRKSIPRIGEEIREVHIHILTYISRRISEDASRTTKVPIKPAGTKWNVLPRNYSVKTDQNATNLCIMLLIQHCGRNSAAPPVSPLLAIMDRPIFTPARNSGSTSGYKSRLSVTYRRAKAAILLSYFLFNSHQGYRVSH